MILVLSREWVCKPGARLHPRAADLPQRFSDPGNASLTSFAWRGLPRSQDDYAVMVHAQEAARPLEKRRAVSIR
jgi:hypothetical protein